MLCCGQVTPWTVIEKWHNEGRYTPYGALNNGEALRELLLWTKSQVFPWIRLNRVIRDIPNQHILGGNANVNMRQASMQASTHIKHRPVRAPHGPTAIPPKDHCCDMGLCLHSTIVLPSLHRTAHLTDEDLMPVLTAPPGCPPHDHCNCCCVVTTVYGCMAVWLYGCMAVCVGAAG